MSKTGARLGRERAWMFGVLTCAWQVMQAQTPLAPPVFRILGTEQGLPSRQVQVLTQDQQGRIWIGTAFGLVRYDGQATVSYAPRSEDPHALRSGSIEALLTDPAGRVWIASEGGYLARWRPESDDFERIELTGMPSTEAIEIWSLAAHREQVYLGTYGAGILQLDSTGSIARRFGTDAGLPSINIVDLLASEAGVLWMVTMEGQLARFDPATQRGESIAVSAAPLAIALRGETLQFSTRRGELCNVGSDLKPVCASVPTLLPPGSGRPLLPDARGDWVGGNGELMRRLGEQIQRISFAPGSIGGVPRQRLSTALMDREQGLWFGSFGGGLLYLPAEADRFSVWQPSATGQSGLRDGRVRGIARDAAGRVYIGTMNTGVHRLDPRSGQIDALPTPPGAATRVFALAFQAPDTLWVGSTGGLSQQRIAADGTLQPEWTWPAEQLLGANVDLLYVDPAGSLWAASMGTGINRIDPRTGAITQFPFVADGFAGIEAQMLGAGPDGRLWVAVDRGLYAHDPVCDCFQTLIANARVDAFALAPDARIYVLVDGQLVVYRWRQGLFRDEGSAPRTFAEFQSVGGMIWIDDALWLAGIQGLFRYQPEQDRLTTWDTRDGLASTEFSDRPFFQDAQGRLWLGSEEGLVSLDPRKSTLAARPAQLRFERIELDTPQGPLRLDPQQPAALDADARGFSVGVRMDSLARAHAQRYSIRLAGRDNSWPLPRAQAERYFGTLPPGRYEVQVRAWDGHGQAVSNELHWPLWVRPPWWRSNRAYLIYVLLTGALLLAIEYIRRRRRHAAATLLEAHRKATWAEQLANEKSALVAELSHEIRNPLNGVLGMARLIGETPLEARAQRYLALLTDAGHQLTHLLDDVLDWSRLNAGHGDLEAQAVDISVLLGPCLERYAQQAAAKGLRFDCQITRAIGVRAAPARLTQIVDNLLANAVKYTAHGGISVRVGFDPDDAAYVLLQVSDSGPGLSATELDRLFKPFERLSPTRSTPGTGLGLAISRSLAERMGGALTAATLESGGACFTLRLPRAQLAAPPEPAPTPAGSTLGGLRLLVVEDDPLGRELIETLLAGMGAQVRCEADGLAALVATQTEHFDAALIDWDLPGLSGLELARLLTTRDPRPYLIAVTGRATPEDIDRGRAAGFDAHLAKPVIPERLAAALSKLKGRE